VLDVGSTAFLEGAGMAAVIEIEKLTKTFGPVRALDEFDMTVHTGEIAAFLGPNGAGKSTAIRVLLGLLKADSGTINLLGGDPWRDAVALHRRIVYVPGDVNLWPQLTGGEAIDVLHRLRSGVSVRRRDELIERFELDPSKKGRTYSKGNRQKVALVAALSSDVELYVLDEPTSGLDPLMEKVFQDCVRELRGQGRTVLLSSHILAEVEKLCDTVTIIRNGRTVQAGRLADLRHLTRTRVVATVRQDPAVLATLPGVHDLVREQDGEVSFKLDTEHTGEVMRALAALDLVGITSNPPSLEELFLRHYSDETDR
jgi:ABC-2 type transport system ATP-binding protein